ncbi:hypothetical protein PRIPAC_79858 [Pristionchus pacificus]|uniref:Uncharacterized protein n=1 Tax=Pristionchus pacificus TaxID=54126 RepID=A0A2A6BWH0_PRIPA|nr:hypothetical protein PRIPAC_79858 [Pristionchus pacificus]|eukprot:PDM70123.1 hypothetical protein PRIPAC_46461 [Pristionchus pacificus]
MRAACQKLQTAMQADGAVGAHRTVFGLKHLVNVVRFPRDLRAQGGRCATLRRIDLHRFEVATTILSRVTSIVVKGTSDKLSLARISGGYSMNKCCMNACCMPEAADCDAGRWLLWERTGPFSASNTS